MGESNLVVGIDGGGTSTRAVAATREGDVLGWGTADGCNFQNVGVATAVERIGLAVRRALAQADRPFDLPAAMFVGTAGVRTESDARMLGDAICTTGLARSGQLTVANDTENAHAAGLRGRPGVALICGTGSIALGRNASGRSFLCGGWGWLLDDVASGAWLGQQALRAVMRAVDGRVSDTTLWPKILAALKVKDTTTLVERVYGGDFGAAEFARIAPLVIDAARERDAVATALLQQGADEAARLVRGAARGAGLGAATEVVLVGGVARSGAPYQPLIETAIERVMPDITFVEPTLPPIFGALLRALALAHVSITAELIARLEQSSAPRTTSHA